MNWNEYPSGVLDFCDIAELYGSARLSQILRSSLSPSFAVFVPESDLCETPTEEAKSQVARVAGKFAHVPTNLSPPDTSDFGIEMLFLDHENGLSAISGITFVNILKASHFLCCFRNLQIQALRTNSIYLILHIVRISRREMKTCTSKKPDLSLTSSPTASMCVRNLVCKPNNY